MGYLLRETLKTVCEVNQWFYAVFWKIGCQNPKLLIWDECYCVPCSGLPGISRNDSPEITFQDYDASWISAETRNLQIGVQAGNKVHLLINKMMSDNHVNIVGEGLVGRAAFTGNHQWILSENYHGEGHPPEVLKEVFQQFSAGMQTVAVIPVLPHGVVQFGSYLTIKENMGFVNDVTSLVLQLGYVPGVLLSDNYAERELTPKIGVQDYLGISSSGDISLESNMINTSPFLADGFNNVRSSAPTPVFDSQTSYSIASMIPNDLQSNFAVFQVSNSSGNDYHQEAKIAPAVQFDWSSSNPVMNGATKAEVIPSNSEIWINQYSSSSSSISNHGRLRCAKQKILTDSDSQDHFNDPSVSTGIMMSALRTNSGLISNSNEDSVTLPSVVVNGLLKGLSTHMKSLSGIVSFSDANRSASENITSKHPTSSGFRNVNLSEVETSFSGCVDHLTPSFLPSYGFSSKHHHMDNKFAKNELNACKEEIEYDSITAPDIPRSQFNENLNIAECIPYFVEDDRKQNCSDQCYSVKNTNYKDACVQTQSGNDLFDICGADFKNKLFSSSWNNCLNNGSAPNTYNRDNNIKSRASSEIYSTSEGHSDSGIFTWTGTDNLLDAVVAKVHPSSKQSLDDNVSCRTTLTNTSSSSAPNASLRYGRFGVSDHMNPKYPAKEGNVSACSLQNGSSKEYSGMYSQGSSICGSQLSSWIEKGHNTKQNNSVSSEYSKKPDEMSKTNRKRLKPGENPKRRPKDRQMIQDRVKELREIVPNGAKCSIDALLERTIKHMLFLQSVTKHADKLKQAGESKIISKDGGLLLKDNFEGGATWAYEVGSQSMICPIIVEDLNQPRQMLVEMLCEERGMFLEIADIIRGMGLTILKGIMETRNDKICARFAVEANRDVMRMEIFISLVRLLDQNAKNGVAPPNGISTDNMVVQQFHQAASVPAIGRSRCLQ